MSSRISSFGKQPFMKDDPLRCEIARRFKESIATLRISKTQAAKDLHVSRQMLYQYLEGKSLPKHAVLQRACSEWKLELKYNTLIVNAASFPQPIPKGAPWRQLDLNLQAAIEQLENQNVAVRILRKVNGRVELQVDLDFGSPGRTIAN